MTLNQRSLTPERGVKAYWQEADRKFPDEMLFKHNARDKGYFDLFRVKHSIAVKTFSADDFFATPTFPAATAAMHEWFRSGPLLEASVVLPLEEVVEANRLLERGEVLGKIALRP